MRAFFPACVVLMLAASAQAQDDSLQAKAGRVLGEMAAPFFALGSELRQARFFHPSGRTYYGVARSVATDPAFEAEAKRLEGGVLTRMGGGLLKFAVGDKESDLPDVPGIALRFEQPTDHPTTDAHPGDQDLTFCAYTERFRTLVTGISFLMADNHDFMNNDYFPDVPFEIAGIGTVWLKLSPVRTATHGRDRAERFDNAVREGKAVFTLSAQRTNASWSREWLGVDVGKLVTTGSFSKATASNPWIPLVEIEFKESVDLDQGKLKFDPKSSGRGLTPTGIVTEIRAPVYAASQASRPQSEGFVKRLDPRPVVEGQQ